MKRIKLAFEDAQGRPFREPEVVEYDATGTAAEEFEEFWVLDAARAKLGEIALEYPTGPAADEDKRGDVPE